MERRIMKRIYKILSWSILWFAAFWIFFIIQFPAETVRDWLVYKLENRLNVRVSVERLALKWNLDMELRGISVSDKSHGSKTSEASHPLEAMAFTLKISRLTIIPSLPSLVRMRPEVYFNGNAPSGGSLSGSYHAGDLSISFKDVSFKDIIIPAFPLPSATTIGGSGQLKVVKGKGMIEVEIDGIPGGRQRVKLSGGGDPGLEGKVKIMVLLPKV